MYNTKILVFITCNFCVTASYTINLRVEPTSPIQAMSFRFIYLVVYFFIFKNYKIMEKKL